MQFDKEKALKAAEKFSQQGNYSAAITEYQKIIAAEPANYMAINTLGDLFVRAGQNQEAIQHFFAVAEEYRKSGFAVKASHLATGCSPNRSVRSQGHVSLNS